LDMSLQKRTINFVFQIGLISLISACGIASAETIAFTCVRSEGSYSEEYDLKIVLPDPKNPKAKAKVYLDERDLDQRDEQGYQEVKNVQVSKSTVSFLTDTYFESEVFDGVKYPPGTVVATTTIQRETGQLKRVETIKAGILAKTLGEGTKTYTEKCGPMISPAQ